MERSDLKTEPTRCLGSVTPCSVPLGRLSQTISKVTKMIGTKERFKRSRRSSQRFPPQMFPYMAQGHEYSYVYIMYCFFGPSTALKWKWHALYKKKYDVFGLTLYLLCRTTENSRKNIHRATWCSIFWHILHSFLCLCFDPLRFYQAINTLRSPTNSKPFSSHMAFGEPFQNFERS